MFIPQSGSQRHLLLMLIKHDTELASERIGSYLVTWKLINRFRNWKDGHKERTIDTLAHQKSWLFHKWSFFAEERKESDIKLRAVAIQGTLGTVQFRIFCLSVSRSKLRLLIAMLLNTQRSFLPLGKTMVGSYVTGNNRRCVSRIASKGPSYLICTLYLML